MNRATGQAASKTEYVLAFEEVPLPPEDATSEIQPNGDRIVVSGLDRWRYYDDDTLKYFIRYQAGPDGRPLIAERFVWMYEGRR